MQACFAKKWIFAAFAALLLLTGCGKENLYENLDEREANEILVVLYQNGVEADKLRVEGSQETVFTVKVAPSEIQKARQILVDHNLPRKKELGFSGICKEKGLIPTPEEEKCRKLLALKGEIINSLERVPGVIDADVVLNIPEISEFATEEEAKKKPTASAVIRVQKAVAGEDVQESRMQRFISNAVENLDPRDVAVIISYVTQPNEIIKEGPKAPEPLAEGQAVALAQMATLAGLTMTVDSHKRFKLYAVVMLVILLGISAALILNVIKLTKMRQELKVSRAQSGGEAALSPGTPLLEQGSQSEAPQLQSGEGEKASQGPRA